MVVRGVLLGFLLNFFCSGLFSETITLKGNNPGYGVNEITFYRYKNQITSNEEVATKFNIDSAGNFETTFSATETQYIFAHIGIFYAYLFVEPGNTYHIKLPPFIPKKQDEILNPFFNEFRIHILVTSNQGEGNDQNLNLKISEFNQKFDSIYTQYSIKTYTNQHIRNIDSTINKLYSQYGDKNDEFYSSYFFYRIGLLKFSTARLKSRYVSDNWFLNKPVLYNNPAYMELFNQVYDKYFVYFGRTNEGRKLYTDINTNSSLAQLKATLGEDEVLKNDTLKEMVILKGIFDGFYQMEFSRNGLLNILDSVIYTTKIALHKVIALDIKQTVTKLLSGYPAPNFKLYNAENKLISLENFRGKYIYLNFATTQNYACLKDLELLKRIQEKYGKYLNVVTISMDENSNATFVYAKKKGYNWPFLHFGNQPEILKEYDLRIYPTYYLIDGTGKLIWSHAPGPSENFDTKLFEELRLKGIL